jgi:hypothetical protein
MRGAAVGSGAMRVDAMTSSSSVHAVRAPRDRASFSHPHGSQPFEFVGSITRGKMNRVVFSGERQWRERLAWR